MNIQRVDSSHEYLTNSLPHVERFSIHILEVVVHQVPLDTERLVLVHPGVRIHNIYTASQKIPTFFSITRSNVDRFL